MRAWLFYGVLWLAMLALRHDFWWWSDKRLLFGFLPVGLASQAAYSLLCMVVMAWLVRRHWPAELERLESDE